MKSCIIRKISNIYYFNGFYLLKQVSQEDDLNEGKSLEAQNIMKIEDLPNVLWKAQSFNLNQNKVWSEK